MLDSSPGRGEDAVAIRDVAELLLEGVQRRSPIPPASERPAQTTPVVEQSIPARAAQEAAAPQPIVTAPPPEPAAVTSVSPAAPARKVWSPKKSVTAPIDAASEAAPEPPSHAMAEPAASIPNPTASGRKVWAPKKTAQASVEPLPRAARRGASSPGAAATQGMGAQVCREEAGRRPTRRRKAELTQRRQPSRPTQQKDASHREAIDRRHPNKEPHRTAAERRPVK